MLETYLDGALEAESSSQVRRRLADEAPLSAALEEIQAQRAMRVAVWKAMEPLGGAAEQLSWRIRGAMADRRQDRAGRWGTWSMTRVGSVAAACIVMGFFAGWTGRGNRLGSALPLAGSEVAVNQPAKTTASSVTDPAGLVVPVTDEYGRVVALQRFHNLDDAQHFSEDLHRVQGSESAAQNMKLISDEQY